jgi:hypothetical protein
MVVQRRKILGRSFSRARGYPWSVPQEGVSRFKANHSFILEWAIPSVSMHCLDTLQTALQTTLQAQQFTHRDPSSAQGRAWTGMAFPAISTEQSPPAHRLRLLQLAFQLVTFLKHLGRLVADSQMVSTIGWAAPTISPVNNEFFSEDWECGSRAIFEISYRYFNNNSEFGRLFQLKCYREFIDFDVSWYFVNLTIRFMDCTVALCIQDMEIIPITVPVR